MARTLPLLLALMALVACSPRRTALRFAADAVAASGGGWGQDDDPELIRAAAPFALKTMEGLLEQQPEHERLLTSLAGGFAQYGYAFVQQDADRAELDQRMSEARALRDRARRLYLRARDYGLRGLAARRPGLGRALLAGARHDLGAVRAGLAVALREDVPLLYWTGASWALAISASKDRMELVAELPVAEALAARALELDEAWEEGTLHDFFLSLEAARGGAGATQKARAHLERSLALSGGRRLSPLVNFAESVSVPSQDRAEFTRLLERVLAADVEAAPKQRLANVISRRRARMLLDHADDLFL